MLSRTDQAKYPVIPEAAEYVRERGLTVDELVDQSYTVILDRAEQRLRQAVEEGSISSEWQDDDVEILSFPVSIYFVTILQDDWVRRRFALAESRRMSRFLANEDVNKIVEISSRTFHWKFDLSRLGMNERTVDLRVDFKNYIKNAIRIRESKWKLANRQLSEGFVLVTKEETTRLLEEEIQSRILSRTRAVSKESSFLEDRLERLRKLVKEKKGTIAPWEMPKTVVFSAIPPCIRSLYDSTLAGRHMSHAGRFALTCFLVNIGASEEDLLRLFKAASDFDENKTRYQVEHIAGSRGGKTKYTPPKCSTLKTHSLCISPDELCKSINHPLSYYRRKLRPILQKDRRHARS